MIVRIYADHDFNEAVLRQLERLNVAAVVRARSVNLQESSDPEVLAWAAERGLPVLSHDVRTMRRYAYERIAAGLPMPGLILVHQRMAVGVALAGVREILEGPLDMQGLVKFVPQTDDSN